MSAVFGQATTESTVNPFEALHTGRARLPSVDAIQAELSRRDLGTFVRRFWHVLEHSNQLDWNWHIELLCQTLMQLSRRELRGAAICVPPGTLKSTLVSVLWPAWEWLPGNWPDVRGLYVAGTQKVSYRDAWKTRTLLDSPEYERDRRLLATANGSDDWTLSVDQNQKHHFENNLGGGRYAVTVGQRITGLRGSKVVVDDPYDVDQVLQGDSERIAERMKEVVTWYDKKLYSRRNDLRSDPILIIMQRLHPNDLAGVVMDRKQDGWRHLVLPLEYDPEIAIPEDKRTTAGEVLDPIRFPPHVVEETKARLGDQYSAQYGQRPLAASGGMYKSEWFKRMFHWIGEGWRTMQVQGHLPEFHRRIVAVDCANKAKELSDYTVFGHWGQCHEHNLYRLNQWRDKLDFPNLLRMACAIIESEQPDVFVCEEAGNGIALIPMLREIYPGLTVVGIVPKGEKVVRASNSTHWWSSGRVFVPDEACPWRVTYVEEHCKFPNGLNDDQVDETSLALNWFHENRALFRYRAMVGGVLISDTGDIRNPVHIAEAASLPLHHMVDLVSAPKDLGGYRQREPDDGGGALWGALRPALGLDQ